MICYVKGSCLNKIKGRQEDKMAGSIYGKLFRVSTWGESHGKGEVW